MPIDFVKLWRDALAKRTVALAASKTHGEADQAAANVLEQAFAAAVEEERGRALEAAANLAEQYDTFDYDTKMSAAGASAACGIASAIRVLIGQPREPMP